MTCLACVLCPLALRPIVLFLAPTLSLMLAIVTEVARWQACLVSFWLDALQRWVLGCGAPNNVSYALDGGGKEKRDTQLCCRYCRQCRCKPG